MFSPDIAAGNNPTGENAENLPERLLSKSKTFIEKLFAKSLNELWPFFVITVK